MKKSLQAASEATTEEDATCAICFETPQKRGQLGCGHAFCFGCIYEWSQRENTCPLCKRRFHKIAEVVDQDKALNVSDGTGRGGLRRKRCSSGGQVTRQVKVRRRDQAQRFAPGTNGSSSRGARHLAFLGSLRHPSLVSATYLRAHHGRSRLGGALRERQERGAEDEASSRAGGASATGWRTDAAARSFPHSATDLRPTRQRFIGRATLDREQERRSRRGAHRPSNVPVPPRRLAPANGANPETLAREHPFAVASAARTSGGQAHNERASAPVEEVISLVDSDDETASLNEAVQRIIRRRRRMRQLVRDSHTAAGQASPSAPSPPGVRDGTEPPPEMIVIDVDLERASPIHPALRPSEALASSSSSTPGPCAAPSSSSVHQGPHASLTASSDQASAQQNRVEVADARELNSSVDESPRASHAVVLSSFLESYGGESQVDAEDDLFM